MKNPYRWNMIRLDSTVVSSHCGLDISYDIDRDVNLKKNKQARAVAHKFTRDIYRLVEEFKNKCIKNELKIHHITIE